MRIDAHQHYWKIQRNDYGWITPEIPVLYRDFLPSDLKPHLRKHQMDGTVAVQAAPTLAETEYLLDLAARDATILGVIGWLDLTDPDCLNIHEAFSKNPKYKGFRIMIQEMPDPNAILEPQFVETLSWFAQADVPIDLLVTATQLAPLVKLMELVPNMRGVIDHAAKPRIASGELEPWRSQVAALSVHPRLRCKLSGMVTEAGVGWKPGYFTAYVRTVCEWFGPERVMFGSDWPVCLLAASYDQVMDVLLQALPEAWTEVERKRLFGLNAKEFYKLSRTREGD